jgi:tetratricopeptide (TPR) repeat protein
VSVPLVPDGPVRLFYERLHDLHAAAGHPSMRQLQRATRSDRRPTGINPTTIHDAFAAPRLARWEVVREIVARLGGDVDEFRELWHRARDAQARHAEARDAEPRDAEPRDAEAQDAEAGNGEARVADPDGGGSARSGWDTRRPDGESPVPRELPPDVFAFTGRGEQLKRLDELLPDGGTAVVVATITGTAGVGKTALAVHWGHRVAHRFPDGQLYADLRGHADGDPALPVEVLAHLLRGLGVPPEQIPVERDAAAARYRSVLADRRVLVVLDNARNAAQVRPLLPGSPGCLVLVTSRDRLSGLVARDGARRLALDVLPAEEASMLLARVLGVERVAAEPAAVDELARACAYLPLALRLAAATLIDHPGRRVAEHAAALRRDSLGLLEVAEDEHTGVRAALDWSYRALSPERRRLFRTFGLAPGPSLTAEAVGVMTGMPADEAGRLLDRLVAAHLLTAEQDRLTADQGRLTAEHDRPTAEQDRPTAEPVPGTPARDRYRSHDLLRRYAAERAAAEDPPGDRAAALTRLLSWYLRGADAAARLAYPHRLRLPMPDAPGDDRDGPEPAFADPAAALAWLDDERPNLVAAIRYAADHGPRRVAWLLADTLRSYFWLRMRTVDLEYATDAALRAAEADGDPRAQAATLLSLSNIHHRRRRYADAIAQCTRALALAEEARWGPGQATALGVLATVHRDAGQLADAAAAYDRALALYRREGSRPGEALTLSHLGRTYLYLGRIPEALDAASRALALYREIGSRPGQVSALDTLGEVCHAAGQLAAALTHHADALALAREGGDRGAEAYALRNLAEARRDLGTAAGEPGAHDVGPAGREPGAALGGRGKPARGHGAGGRDTSELRRALSLAESAVALAEEVGDLRIRADAWNTLGSVHRERGRPAVAIDHHRTVLDLLGDTGDPHPRIEALIGLALAEDRLGHGEAAARHARAALNTAGRTGFIALAGRARRVLDLVRREPGPAADTTGHEPGPAADTTGHEPGPAADTTGHEPGPAADTTGPGIQGVIG